MKVKEESEKVGLKLNIQKTKIMASSPITSWQIHGETMKTVTDFIFLSFKVTADRACSHKIKRFLLLRRKSMTNLVQFSCSVVSDSLQPHEPQHARPPCLSPTPGVHPNSYPLNRWCHPTISSSPPLLLPSIFPNIRVFSNESALCIRWPKYWSFSFNISPSNEHPELISFRMDWLDLLAVQGTLKSLLQHHSSKASILQRSLSFLHSPTLTFIHDHWKNHSFD